MKTALVHPSAIVHPSAKIDPSCEIGPYCVVGPSVKMGANNKLLSHVVIDSRTTIGEENIFHPFAVIGGKPQDLKYHGEDTELHIGNQNTIRESVTLNIGTEGGGGVTSVGNQNLLMAYTHLGHDTRVGNFTVIANSCQIAGHVLIEDWAILGGASAVSQFMRIGEHAYIGGGSGIDRDVPPYAFGRGPAGAFEILGLNLVGLKRRKFTDEQISSLQDVGKMFFKDKTLEKSAALDAIEKKVGSVDVVKKFIDFVRAAEKGVYR